MPIVNRARRLRTARVSRSPRLSQWSKLTAAKWEDAWRETLLYLGETRLAIVSLPHGKRVRLQLFDLNRREADDVKRRFGGTIRPQEDNARFFRKPAPRRPIRIRKRLIIVNSANDSSAGSSALRLVIPAGMAFGTGEHGTTATCLRLLCDAADALNSRAWDFLDLGTGTGILALAGYLLGARRVDAYDFDPVAVRTANANAAANGIAAVRFRRNDVTRWNPSRAWDVVTANLYSTILLDAVDVITRAVRPGGCLIFSGILREQEKECVAAFSDRGFVPMRLVRTGKWVAVSAQKGVMAKPSVLR